MALCQIKALIQFRLFKFIGVNQQRPASLWQGLKQGSSKGQVWHGPKGTGLSVKKKVRYLPGLL